MSLSSDPIRNDAPTARHLLRCGACGRTDDCSPTDRLRHTRHGWPRCCGEVMTLFVAAGSPTDDTAPDHTPVPGPHPV